MTTKYLLPFAVLLSGVGAPGAWGLDQVYYTQGAYTGSWKTLNVNAGYYKALAEDSTNSGPAFVVFGVRSDGTGVSQIVSHDWGYTWTEHDIWSTNYRDIAAITGLNGFYGARADGTGLDRVWWNGSEWISQQISSVNYKALAAEATHPGPVFIVHAARADGTGVDQVISTDWGENWSTNFITGTDYKKLQTMSGIANQFYAARADGTGLDRVYFAGNQWNTLPVVSTDYKALAREATQTGPRLVVHGARADGSGVYQIISENWGSTWAENYVVGTDYDELAVKNGVANQFYGCLHHRRVAADFDDDRDVYLVDFGMFQACFNGPNRPPKCH